MPLVFVVLGGTVFGVGSAAVEAKAKIDKRNKELTDAAPKCQAYLDNLDLQQGRIGKTAQPRLGAKSTRLKPGSFTGLPASLAWTVLTSATRSTRTIAPSSVKTTSTLREYEELPAIIAPTKFAGNGWNNVLRYRPGWNTLPTSEDCWLAIEDLCVQREILKDIHNVNQLLARFLPEPLLPDETGLDDKQKQKNKADYEAAKVKVDKGSSRKSQSQRRRDRRSIHQPVLDARSRRDATARARNPK